MKKVSKTRLVLALLCAAVAVWGWYEVRQVEPHLQYVVSAPAPEEAESTAAGGTEKAVTNAPVTALMKSLQKTAEGWTESIEKWTAGGWLLGRTVSEEKGESSSVNVTLCGEKYFEICPQLIETGRLLYSSELKYSANVCVLDEPAALALFHTAEAVDREVTLEGMTFRVVGVTRHTDRVGEDGKPNVWIALADVLEKEISIDALFVEAVPIENAGAGTGFTESMKSWKSGGTVIDLNKEKTGATLWLRMLIFLMGVVIVLWVISELNRATIATIRYFQMRLRDVYANRIAIPVFFRGLLLVLGYAGCAAAMAGLMNLVLAPIYVFPEWIPAVVVEWDEVSTTFWNVWHGWAARQEWRTPELLRLRWLTIVLNMAAAGLGMICFAAIRSWRTMENDRRERKTEE